MEIKGLERVCESKHIIWIIWSVLIGVVLYSHPSSYKHQPLDGRRVDIRRWPNEAPTHSDHNIGSKEISFRSPEPRGGRIVRFLDGQFQIAGVFSQRLGIGWRRCDGEASHLTDAREIDI